MDISLWKAWTATVFSKLAKNRQGVSSVLFYGYYALLVLAKGLGYSNGGFFYNMFFYVAAILWLVKMILTDYTLREIIWIAVFLLISLWMYVKLGELTGILLWMTVVGLKNCNFEILMKLTMVVRGLAVAVVIAFSAVGLLAQNSIEIEDNDFALRYVYGFAYGKQNLLFLSGFLTVVAILYVFYDRLNLLWLFGTLIPMVVLYELTYCRTGILLFGLLWIMIAWEKFVKWKGHHRIYRWVYVLAFLISLLATVFYRPGNLTMQKINHLFNGRIEITNTYYSTIGFSLFPRDISVFSFNLNRIIDNLYMSLSLTSGLVIGGIFVILMTGACFALCRKKCYRALIFMVIFAMYAILEEFPLNPSMNPFIMLLAVLLYRDTFVLRETTNVDERSEKAMRTV
jgi:hypothetical protein